MTADRVSGLEPITLRMDILTDVNPGVWMLIAWLNFEIGVRLGRRDARLKSARLKA